MFVFNLFNTFYLIEKVLSDLKMYTYLTVSEQYLNIGYIFVGVTDDSRIPPIVAENPDMCAKKIKNNLNLEESAGKLNNWKEVDCEFNDNTYWRWYTSELYCGIPLRRISIHEIENKTVTPQQ